MHACWHLVSLVQNTDSHAVWLEPNLYEYEEHMFGRIPIVVMLGDFMQLAVLE